jgi:plasmid stability protein
MATLTLKNFPDDIYAQLKARAAANRRSMNAEAIRCLETVLTGEGSRADIAATLEGLRRARSKVRHTYLTDRDLQSAKATGRA